MPVLLGAGASDDKRSAEAYALLGPAKTRFKQMQDEFLQTIVTRVDANEEIFKKILDDEDFRATLGEFYLRKVYDRLQATP